MVSIVVKVWNEKCSDKQWHNLKGPKCSWYWNKLVAVIGFLFLGQMAMYSDTNTLMPKTLYGQKGIGLRQVEFSSTSHPFPTLFLPCTPLKSYFRVKNRLYEQSFLNMFIQCGMPGPVAGNLWLEPEWVEVCWGTGHVKWYSGKKTVSG